MKYQKALQITIYTLCLTQLSACGKFSPLSLWRSVQAKSQELLTLEVRFGELDKKHQELKKDYYELEHRYISLLAKVESEETSTTNVKLTGSVEGRTLASIDYQVPKDMAMDQIYELAFVHMKEKRFAEAAKTFEYFLSSPEGAPYQTSKAFYEAGVAWYQLKNYIKSKENFEAARARASIREKKELDHRIDLWMRVIEQQKNKDV